MSLIQNQRSHVYKERAIDYFDTLYEEASGSVRIMSFAVHPYISGSPHRIRYVRELLEYMLEKPGVVVMTGEQILDWYMSEKT